jgi:hypothetical protein
MDMNLVGAAFYWLVTLAVIAGTLLWPSRSAKPRHVPARIRRPAAHTRLAQRR